MDEQLWEITNSKSQNPKAKFQITKNKNNPDNDQYLFRVSNTEHQHQISSIEYRASSKQIPSFHYHIIQFLLSSGISLPLSIIPLFHFSGHPTSGISLPSFHYSISSAFGLPSFHSSILPFFHFFGLRSPVFGLRSLLRIYLNLTKPYFENLSNDAGFTYISQYKYLRTANLLINMLFY